MKNSHRCYPVALAALALLVGCERKPLAPEVVPDSTATGTVTIEIVSPDSTKAFKVENVAAGATVEEVMRLLPKLSVEISGSGSTAFLHSIDGKETSASEGWTYKIDDEFIHAGIGATTLTPPTTVTWKFSDGDEMLAQ